MFDYTPVTFGKNRSNDDILAIARALLIIITLLYNNCTRYKLVWLICDRDSFQVKNMRNPLSILNIADLPSIRPKIVDTVTGVLLNDLYVVLPSNY